MNDYIAWLLAEQRLQQLRAEAADDALVRLCTATDVSRAGRGVGGWWRRRAASAPPRVRGAQRITFTRT